MPSVVGAVSLPSHTGIKYSIRSEMLRRHRDTVKNKTAQTRQTKYARLLDAAGDVHDLHVGVGRREGQVADHGVGLQLASSPQP